VERPDGAVVELQERRIGRRLFQPVVRHQPQHPRRVVGGRAPRRVVEAPEHLAGLGVPAPPQVDGEIFETGDALRERRKVRVSMIHGWHAPTSAANLVRSMLPPETTATIFSRRPPPRVVDEAARPLSAAAMAQPAAPSAMTCTRSAASFIARATSSSETTIEPVTVPTSGHIVGRTDLPPAPSTNEALQLSK